MALTTLTRVKAYLGLTDSTYDTLLGYLISAVDDAISRYCNRNFTKDNYAVVQYGSDNLHEPWWPEMQCGDNGWNSVNYPTIRKQGELVVLDNLPVSAVLYAAYGMQTIIDIQYDGSSSGYVDFTAGEKLVLVENLTKTEIAITDSSTVQDLITAISAETNWTATASDADYTSYPAKCIVAAGSGPMEDASDDVYLYGCVNAFRLSRQTDGLYRASVKLGSNTPFVVIYEGGYEEADLPASLTETATKAVADAFGNIDLNPYLESEKVGDYSYKISDNFDAFSYVDPYTGSLDLFRRIPMGVQ